MKSRLFIVAAVLGLLATACNKDEVTPQDDMTTKTPITIKANYGNNGSKVSYTESGNTISATWQSGDKLLVIYNNNVNTLDLVDGAGENTATFSGDITGTPSEGAMLVCYVKDQNTPNGTITVNGDGSYIYTSDAFLGQDGTLAEAAKLNLYCGWTRYSSTSDINCALGVNTSMMKFTVSGISDDAGESATITYKSGSAEIAKATFTVVSGNNTIYLTIPAGQYTGEQTLKYICGISEMDYRLSSSQANFTSGQTYSKAITYDKPLTFEARISNSTVTFFNDRNSTHVNLEYSLNGGAWTTYSTAITLENVGDKVSFRGDNETVNATTSGPFNKFSCTGQCYVYGNIMSILSSTGFSTATTLTTGYALAGLFYGNTYIYNHPSNLIILPATTLSKSCYYDMFYGCTNLTSAPTLPAMTLANSCYVEMFYRCTNLTSAPDLPATTLYPYCYNAMFRDCTSLTYAPSSLPATSLPEGCYGSMFYNCTSLLSAPSLLATAVGESSCSWMFYNCTSLTSAPDLLATTLQTNSYVCMFRGCSNLTSIKCLATDISAYNCTANWLMDVSASGTFTKASSMTSWTSGKNGIPSGWSINNQ